MKRQRINFSAWGGSRGLRYPAYAVQADSCENPQAVVARAIARANGLTVGALALDGIGSTGRVFALTLCDSSWGNVKRAWFALEEGGAS